MTTVDRGHIVYRDFYPQMGHEQAGRRPGIVLSSKLFNQSTGFSVCAQYPAKKLSFRGCTFNRLGSREGYINRSGKELGLESILDSN